MCAPRIHCTDQPEPDETLRGGEHEMHGSDRVDTFNRHLREGLGTGRPDNNDE